VEGADTSDPGVLLLYEGEEGGASRPRIAEIVIEHASDRVDLAEMRRKVSFEEVRTAEVST